MEARVNSIDNRLADVEGLTAKNEYHFYQLDLQMNKRFDQVDQRFDRLETAVFSKPSRRFVVTN